MESTDQIHDINVFDLFIIPTKFICVFFDGCLASGTSYFIYQLTEFFERGFVKEKKEESIVPEAEKEMD